MKKKSFFKKSYLWMLAACIGWQATSCTNENDPAGGNESDTVTFTVEPDYSVKTRAAGALPEGAEALRYIMEVYDSGSNLVAGSRQVQSTATPGTAVQFTLAKAPGDTYTVVFWADYTAADKADVYFDTTAGGLKDITLKKALDPAEKCQAFFGTVGIDAQGTPEATTVSLKRAVTQVNLITNNKLIGYKSVKVAYGEAEANAPASHFNALDGTAATNAVISGVVNTVDGTHAATEAAPYTFHTYYVFAPKTTQSVINMAVDLCSDDAGATSVKQIKIASVPVQANYKTNIAGGFGSDDNISLKVSCSEDWETPDNERYVFEGEGTEAAPYLIKSVADLKMLSKNTNNGTADYEGMYFSLESDLDLNNEAWTPISLSLASEDKRGINFDGKGHTISNLNVNGSYANAGLFGYCESIKNLHVEGSVTSTAESSNVGGIAGQIKAHGSLNADGQSIIPIIAVNCSFTGTVTTYGTAGGLIGYVSGTYAVMTGCKNNATVTLRVGPPSDRYIGGLIGGCEEGMTIEGCYNAGDIKCVDGVGSNAIVGGLVGNQPYGGDAGCGISLCYNTGSITGFNATNTGSLGGNNCANKITNCFVKEYYTYENKDNTKLFSADAWPTWTAGPSADGTYGNGYWKSLGSWNEGTPEYPKLWWE